MLRLWHEIRKLSLERLTRIERAIGRLLDICILRDRHRLIIFFPVGIGEGKLEQAGEHLRGRGHILQRQADFQVGIARLRREIAVRSSGHFGDSHHPVLPSLERLIERAGSAHNWRSSRRSRCLNRWRFFGLDGTTQMQGKQRSTARNQQGQDHHNADQHT